MKVRVAASASAADARVVPVFADAIGQLPPGADGEVPWDFLRARGFKAKPGDVAAAPGAGGVVLYAGVGDAAAVTPATLRRAAGAAARAASRSKSVDVALALAAPEGLDAAAAVAAVAEGLVLGAYRFDAYQTKSDKPALARATIVDPDGTAGKAVRDAAAAAVATAEAVCLARDLVNEPGGSLTAPAFAERAAEVAAGAGLTATVHDEKAIRRLGLEGLLAVNRGSTLPPRFVELAYDPPMATASTPTVALVGKGITFDSGGLSIKTAEGMATMKCDMGGAAAVLGALAACKARKVPVRVRGYLPMTDNMLGGDAQRVGDVIRHYGGSTTEVLNTDAEGRLILADALVYATEARKGRPQPAAAIDLATLTGACIVALGTRTAGLFSRDDELAGRLLESADRAGELLWRLPLAEPERRRIESKIADRKNTGHRYGGAIHAAHFLSDFVADGVPWAHLDIAGPAFNEEGDDADVPAGGTGYGVRTLLDLLTTWPSPA